MTNKSIKANKGDTLDYIAYREKCNLMTVLILNGQLAHKVTLDANDIVYLPIKKEEKTKTLIRLFG